MTMRYWFRDLFARPIRKAPRRPRLALEALEERAVPALLSHTPVYPAGISLAVHGSRVYVVGSSPGTNVYSNSTNGLGSYTSTALPRTENYANLQVDPENGDVYSLGDTSLEVLDFKSTDNGNSFTQQAL